MSISSTTRFSWLTLAFSSEKPSNITVETVADGNYDFEVTPTAYENTKTNSDFIALQALWAADEIRDPSDNRFTPAVWIWARSNLLSDVEPFGWYNPFDATSWPRWLEGQKVQGRFTHGAALSTEGDVNHEFGMNPILGVPEAGDFDQILEAWRALAVTAARVQFRLIIPVSAGRNTGNVGEYLPLRGMLAYLETVRVKTDSGGDPVGTVMDPYVTTYDQVGAQLNPANQQWRIPQATGQNVDLVLSTVTSISIGSAVVSVQINFNEEAASPNAYDVDALNSLLDITVGSLTGVVTAAVERPSGSPDVDFQGRRWRIDEHRNLEPVNDQVLIHGRDIRLERDYEIPWDSTYSRSMPYDDLRNGYSGEKLSPVESHVRTIHFGPDATADGILQVEEPPKFVLSPGGEKDLELHNDDAVRTFQLKDWNRDVRMTLRPGEKLSVRGHRRRNGTGSLRGLQVPTRYAIATRGEYGTLGSTGYYGAGANRAYPLPQPLQSEYSRFDTEAFEIGTETWTDGVNWGASAVVFSRYTLKILQSGDLIYKKKVQVNVQGSGNLPSSHYVEMLIERQGAFWAGAPGIQHQNALTGLDTSHIYTLDYVGPIQAGDIIVCELIAPISSSLAVGNVRVDGLEESAILVPDIDVEYTP